MDARIVEKTLVWDGHVRVWRARLVYADGSETWREITHHGDSISVLPYDAERRVALTVRLLRAPPLLFGQGGELEEACAGIIDPGEDAETTTRREAMEEMGVRLGALENVGLVRPSPGVSAERAYLFLAHFTPADRIAEGGGLPTEHENITVLERPLADLAAEADAGRLEDLCLLTLVQTLRLRKPKLFASPAGLAGSHISGSTPALLSRTGHHI